MNSDKNNIDICPICIENLIDDFITTPCKHKIHNNCYKIYTDYEIKQNKTTILCPLCKNLLFDNPETQVFVIEIPVENHSHPPQNQHTKYNILLTLSCFGVIGFCLLYINGNGF